MSDIVLTERAGSVLPEGQRPKHRPHFVKWFIHALPFLILGAGAIVGMAWTTLTGRPKEFYWALYTPVAALVCILEGWRIKANDGDYTGVFFKQLAQWLTVGAAMYILMLSPVRGLMNDDAVGLTLLTFIAMSVFIAGIDLRAWRLLVMGAFLAGTVEAISFVEAYAIAVMTGILVVLSLLGFAFWAFRRSGAER